MLEYLQIKFVSAIDTTVVAFQMQRNGRWGEGMFCCLFHSALWRISFCFITNRVSINNGHLKTACTTSYWEQDQPQYRRGEEGTCINVTPFDAGLYSNSPLQLPMKPPPPPPLTLLQSRFCWRFFSVFMACFSLDKKTMHNKWMAVCRLHFRVDEEVTGLALSKSPSVFWYIEKIREEMKYHR